MAYIEDTNLIEEIKSLKISVGGKDVFSDEAKESVLRVINEQPTADVVEVKHGKWERSKRGLNLDGDYECSMCHSPDGIKHFYGLKKYSYCPYCGAKMDGGKTE